MKPMAITRCPYCHAIIDENDKYCNNCGTQLLFPDDEETDEEIPGEKIVEAEVEEKDYTVDEPEDEKRLRAAADDDEDLDERLEEEMRDRAAETALDEIVAEGGLDEGADDVTEEVILVDEIEEVGASGPAGTGELETGMGTGSVSVEEEGPEEDEDEREEEAEDEKDEEDGEPEEEAEEDEEDDEEDDKDEEAEHEDEAEIEKAEEAEAEKEGETGPPEPSGAEEGETRAPGEGTAEDELPREAPPAADEDEEPVIEYITETGAENEPGAAERIPSPRPATFDTRELESIGRTVELGKDKVDELLADLAEKGGATPEPEPVPAAAETPREPTGSLPPWASGMRGAPVFPPDTTPLDAKTSPRERGATPEEEEEVEIFPKRRPSDSSIGLPERVSQAPLPFAGEAAEESEGAAEEAEAETEEETAEAAVPPPKPARPDRPAFTPGREPEAVRIEDREEYEEPEARGPFSFAVFLKSKAFDLLFVGLFWLVALWLAAHATDRTLFEVLGAVSGPMFLLYAVFVLLYFFLFRFFLGETLGDRLFRPRD